MAQAKSAPDRDVVSVKGRACADESELSHNLLGQRLGRKGRDTRERIVAAAQKLLAGPPDTPISLSAVAREASLGMTTLYLYFSDLTELLLAALNPIIASSEETFLGHLRSYWPDNELSRHCLQFVEAYHDFWAKHTRILHLRNHYADNNDERMRHHRISTSQTLITLLIQQMGADPAEAPSPESNLASVLFTAVDRLATVTTDATFPSMTTGDTATRVRSLMLAAARVLELGLRDARSMVATRKGTSRPRS